VGFARTIGGAVGVVALGAVLAAGLRDRDGAAGSSDALLNPELRATSSPDKLAALRGALASALSAVFPAVLLVVVAAVALVALGLPLQVRIGDNRTQQRRTTVRKLVARLEQWETELILIGLAGWILPALVEPLAILAPLRLALVLVAILWLARVAG
jgi:hypothetical protein